MTPAEREWTYEKERLERTLEEVSRRIKAVEATLGQHRSEVISARVDMWENMPRLVRSWDDIVELTQNQELLNQQERNYLFYSKMLPTLRRLADSPYFGRIDFQAEHGMPRKPIQVYIGIAGLTHAETGEHLIYDWRAPISSMFYDYEPGPASYKAHGGRIDGEILLKRQYKIERGELRYMFDTDLKIDDDLLQEILGKSADSKMKVIVQTIQREQNKVIRDEDHRLLIVQGPAGSGKTSIALHRVAYFLYRYRGDLRADQVLVLSPNEIFSDYISDVLPELGEENVVQKTFWNYVRAWLDISAETLADQMEFLLGAGGEGRRLRKASIEFKGSPAFLRILQNYVKHLESGAGTPFEDIVFRDKVVVTRESLVELFREQYSYLPYGKRLDKAARRALFLLEPHEAARLEEIRAELRRMSDPDNKNGLSKELRRLSNRMVREETAPIKERVEAWGRVDWMGIYRALFADLDLLRRLAGDQPIPEEIADIARITVEAIDGGRIGYEDAACALYLKAALGGVEAMTHIRHVVVDESQDYSPIHYMAMRVLFPNASFTLLGDRNQAIHPHLHMPDTGELERIFSGLSCAKIRMVTSYRSTREIVTFTKAILGEGEPIEPIDRSGEKPLIVEAADAQSATLDIARTVQSLLGEGFRSIGIICKTASDAHEVHQAIGTRCGAALVTKNDRRFTRGVVVIPSYLAKGLEFDAVVIHDAGQSRYAGEEERKLLYTACTRALHRLVLYCAGEPSPLLAGVPPECYRVAQAEPAR